MAKALALETGYFGVIRNPGDVFDVPNDTKSNRWMMVANKPFVDDEGVVYGTVLNNEVLLPGVVGKLPNTAESNETDGPAVSRATGSVDVL